MASIGDVSPATPEALRDWLFQMPDKATLIDEKTHTAWQREMSGTEHTSIRSVGEYCALLHLHHLEWLVRNRGRLTLVWLPPAGGENADRHGDGHD